MNDLGSLNSLPPNWREFYILAGQSRNITWTEMPRYLGEHMDKARQNRSVHRSKEGIYYALYKAQKTTKYYLKIYSQYPVEQQMEKFFAEEEKKYSLQVACHTDAPYLGLNAPEVLLHLFSKSVAHAVKRKPEKLMQITQSFESVVATREQSGLSVADFYLDEQIDEEKKERVMKRYRKQALINALVYKNVDSLNPNNSIIVDIDQEEPEQFCIFDYEYAGQATTGDIMSKVEESCVGDFSIYANWKELITDLEIISAKAETNRIHIGNERTDMYQENIADALAYFRKMGELLNRPASAFNAIQIALLPLGI